MRSVLVVIALCLTVTVSADPIPCISLNGRAYVPIDQVGVIEAPAEYCRSMCGMDFVWVRTVAEAYGGNLQWSGRHVELQDLNGNLLYSFLPLPPREFWCSEEVSDAYPGLIAIASQEIAPHVGAYIAPPSPAAPPAASGEWRLLERLMMQNLAELEKVFAGLRLD